MTRWRGGDGADVFVFNQFNDGEQDVITGFQPGEDRIRLSGIEGQGLNGRFQALDITMTGPGVELHHDSHTILLEDVGANALSVEDFIFL